MQARAVRVHGIDFLGEGVRDRGSAIEHGGVDLEVLSGGDLAAESNPLLAGVVLDGEGAEGRGRRFRGAVFGLVGDLGAEDAKEVVFEGGLAHGGDVGAPGRN